MGMANAALAVGGNPVPVGDLHAAGRPVGDKDHIVLPVDGFEIGDLSVIGPEGYGTELQLFGDIRGPSLREALPDEDGDRSCPQKAPHGGFERPCIRGGHDTDEVAFGDPEYPPCFLYRQGKLLLSQGGTMRTSDRGVLQGFETPGRPFAAWPGAKIGIVHDRLLL
jgi:hypothetical protein